MTVCSDNCINMNAIHVFSSVVVYIWAVYYIVYAHEFDEVSDTLLSYNHCWSLCVRSECRGSRTGSPSHPPIVFLLPASTREVSTASPPFPQWHRSGCELPPDRAVCHRANQFCGCRGQIHLPACGHCCGMTMASVVRSVCTCVGGRMLMRVCR
jgi:hypothetical protein